MIGPLSLRFGFGNANFYKSKTKCLFFSYGWRWIVLNRTNWEKHLKHRKIRTLKVLWIIPTTHLNSTHLKSKKSAKNFSLDVFGSRTKSRSRLLSCITMKLVIQFTYFLRLYFTLQFSSLFVPFLKLQKLPRHSANSIQSIPNLNRFLPPRHTGEWQQKLMSGVPLLQWYGFVPTMSKLFRMCSVFVILYYKTLIFLYTKFLFCKTFQIFENNGVLLLFSI